MSIPQIELASSSRLFSEFQAVRYPDEDSTKQATEICFINLMRALAGTVPTAEIRKTVGSAATPNALSIAARQLRLG